MPVYQGMKNMKKKKLEKELAETLFKLEYLANMVVGLTCSEMNTPGGTEFVIIDKEAFDGVYDYADTLFGGEP